MITVVIPVGPAKTYKPYLQECLDSIKAQTIPASEVLLVDDMAHVKEWGLDFKGLPITIHENPWLCGCPCSINFGVVLAKNYLSLLIGSDDKLMPWAIEDCQKAWDHYQNPFAYYWCDVQYDNGESQSLACGGAMVTKQLWVRTGGYPPKSVVGANDSIFLDILRCRPGAGAIIRVESEKPPIWCRRHPESLTSKIGQWWGIIPPARELIVAEWEKPEWAR